MKKFVQTLMIGASFYLMSAGVCLAQDLGFEALLDSGKVEFNKPYLEQDYTKAAFWLEQAVAAEPDNAEGHYFLGYAYSRINAKDGGSMIRMELPLLLKTSEQFEQVLAIDSNYQGEMVVLGPHSKLTSEWGSMAMSYWHNDQPDSARWAFQEGQRRGGFGPYFLGVNRLLLDVCEENAILMSSGDNFTFHLWYLQIVEGLRPDVTVTDVSLLNADWYPDYLLAKDIVPFDVAAEAIAALDHRPWKDSTVTIGDFSWVVSPSYYDQYLLRGDQVFLSILNANNFTRPVYFTMACSPSTQVGLTAYLESQVLADRVNTSGTGQALGFKEYVRYLDKALSMTSQVNRYSPEEVMMVEIIRRNAHVRIAEELRNERTENAARLFAIMDQYAPESEWPYASEQAREYAHYLRQQL